MESDASHGDEFGSHGEGRPSEVLGLFAWLLELRRQGTQAASSLAGVWDAELAVRSFGRFRLEGLLGTGAYGAVFCAFDPELGCRVALKIAWPAILLDPETSRRFIEEPKAIAGLTHPGVVRVYDSGQVEMARYISFELIEGPTLAEWIARHQQPPARVAAALIRAVAEAVDFAHQQGIVHRDLKPSNILLRPAADAGEAVPQPVVTDFGLARRAGLPAHSDATATGAMIGTDRYMSPEQAAGQAKDVGPESDVFSLGVILYELVAGVRPFDAETSPQIRERIQQADPPSIRLSRAGVPRDLETIALKCLEKAPAARYASAGALADDLRRFLNHEPILAKRTPAWRRAWKFARRRPGTVAAVSAALLSCMAIAGLAGALVVQRQMATERVELSQRATDVAQAAAAEAEVARRQHEYAIEIRYAARSYQLGNNQELRHHLDEARSVAQGEVRRGLEWELLSNLVENEHRVLPANSGSVRALRFSPDGKLLVSGGSTSQLTFWDAKSWKPMRTVPHRGLGIKAAEFSPDGAYLAVGGEMGWLQVIRMADFSSQFHQKVSKGPIFSLAWLDGGTHLAFGGKDTELAILDVEQRTIRRTGQLAPTERAKAAAPDYPDEISSIAYLPNQKRIAVLKSPPEILLIDPHTLETVDVWGDGIMFHSADSICHVPLGPHYLALAGRSRLYLISATDGNVVASMPTRQYFTMIRYSKATQELVGAFRDGAVQTWNVEDLLAGHETPQHYSLTAHHGKALSCDVSSDGELLVSGGQDQSIRLHRNPSKGRSIDLPLASVPVSMKFSPCGRWLALAERMADGTGLVRFLEVATGRQRWSTAEVEPGLSVFAITSQQTTRIVSFDSTGDIALIREASGEASLRDSSTGRLLRHIAVPEEARSVLLSPDTSTLVIRGSVATRVLELESEALRDMGSKFRVLNYLSTPQGPLWIDSADRILRLRRSPDAKPFRELGPTPDQLVRAAVTADGKLLAASAVGTRTYLWDLTSDHPPERLIAPEIIEKHVFTADGRTLICLTGKRLIFWHVPTKTELLSLDSPVEQLLCMALHPQDQLLVLGLKRGEQHAVRVYRFGEEGQKLMARFEINDPPPRRAHGP